jgi:hypothetical protein
MHHLNLQFIRKNNHHFPKGEMTMKTKNLKNQASLNRSALRTALTLGLFSLSFTFGLNARTAEAKGITCAAKCMAISGILPGNAIWVNEIEDLQFSGGMDATSDGSLGTGENAKLKKAKKRVFQSLKATCDTFAREFPGWQVTLVDSYRAAVVKFVETPYGLRKIVDYKTSWNTGFLNPSRIKFPLNGYINFTSGSTLPTTPTSIADPLTQQHIEYTKPTQDEACSSDDEIDSEQEIQNDADHFISPFTGFSN